MLLAALGAGLAASFAMARVLPTFHAVAALREFTQRPVLGSVSMLETGTFGLAQALRQCRIWQADSPALLVAYGAWVTWVSMNARGIGNSLNTIEQAASRLAQLRSAGVDAPQEEREPNRRFRRWRLMTRQSRSARLPNVGLLHASPEAMTVRVNAINRHRRRSTIDLERLSTMGYVSPHAPSSRRAEEFRMVKRPLLKNARGNSAAPMLHANRIMVTSSLPREGKTFVVDQSRL